MNYIVSANTDIGIKKDTNQDSLTVKLIRTKQGEMVFSVLCDGMGGLDKGEVASASVIYAFNDWVMNELPMLCSNVIDDMVIREQWEKLIVQQNHSIKDYGARCGVKLGTTVVAMLLTQSRYYILNVGDSRAYEINSTLRQITSDQTFVAREVALGNMTEEQAAIDSRRSVLLQCVGASDVVYPEMFFGEVKPNTVYMLCSDGFRHEISPEEIYENLNPDVSKDEETMHRNAEKLIELNKQRMERDNISVVMVRTF